MLSLLTPPAKGRMLESTRPPGCRVIGYDFARAIAIFGMVIVHFLLVLMAIHLGRCNGFYRGAERF